MSDHNKVPGRLELCDKVRKGCKRHIIVGCIAATADPQEMFCPYLNNDSCRDIYTDMMAILEPKPVSRYDQQTQIGACPSCNRALSRYMRFCPVCGQEVVWDD